MEIQEWLHNGADYQQGVKIYQSLKGHSKLLLRQFLLRENAQRKEKLIYELKKFITSSEVIQLITPEIPQDIPSVIESIPQSEIESTIESEKKRIAPLFHELPTELRPILLEANQLFKENCYLKVELNELPIEAEDQALRIQTKIDANFKTNAMCWDKIEFWRKYKILPKLSNQNTIENFSMDKLIKEQHLLNSSLSKMQKRLEENKQLLKVEENPSSREKLLRKITKQEADVLKKRELLLTIKTTIDVKTSSI